MSEAEAQGSGPYRTPSHVRLRAPSNDGNQAAFERAMRAVRDAPEAADAWDELERLCDALQSPDQVADAYLRMLTPSRSEPARQALARRAYAFYQSWYGGDDEAMRRVLCRVLETCPEASWAFDEQVALLTVAERWDELLEAYDRALVTAPTVARRRQLLDEAAHLAKDFMDRPERAVAYVRELRALDVDTRALSASLERMLRERHHFEPLLRLWTDQIEAGCAQDEPRLRLEMAEICLEQLSDPARALDHAKHVLRQRPGDERACTLLERVLSLSSVSASAEVRLESLALLRLHHDSAGRGEATIAALACALGIVPEPQKIELHRELGARSSVRGDDRLAMAHYAEVLKHAANDADALAQLERLAARSGAHDDYARALVTAADCAHSERDTARLLVLAMRVRAERLQDTERAIELGRRVLSLDAAEPTLQREAADTVHRSLCTTERHAEIVDALERLVALEEHPNARRQLVAELSQRAAALADLPRAQAAWDGWLAQHPNDIDALTQAIALAQDLGQAQVQVARLRARAKIASTPQQRRDDLARVARLQHEALHDSRAAIESWLALRKEFGDEPEVLSALDALMSESARFAELARVLESATGRERSTSLERLCRLGDVLRLELKDVEAAARAYARALELDPACEPARNGLRALLGNARCARETTSALAAAYDATEDWTLQLDLLDARLAASDDAKEQARWLLEAAELCEQRAHDPARALLFVSKALTRVPLQAHAERELLRLAELTGHWREAATALHWAAVAASRDAERAADLSALEGRVLERLSDYKGAVDAYRAVLAVRPHAHAEAHGLVRCAARGGFFSVACDKTVRWCARYGVVHAEMLESLEEACSEAEAYPALCEAFAHALLAVGPMQRDIACALELRLCSWALAKCGDLRTAERAAQRAVRLRPDHVEALSLLADVQRATHSPELLETLLALEARSLDAFEPLVEAAQLLERIEADDAKKRDVLTRLYRRARDLWSPGPSGRDYQHWVLWTLERLVPLELAANRPQRAVELLDDAVRLPLATEHRVRLRAESARILEQAGDPSEALRLGLAALDLCPNDLALVTFVGDLAARLERVPDQLVLRQRQLALSSSSDERLRLRLDLSRLTGLLGATDARLRMLLDNLDELCGHPASLEAACALLAEAERYDQLFALFCAQAKGLAKASKQAEACGLLRRAAHIAEHRLSSRTRAIEALEQLLTLTDERAALVDVVRLCKAAGDHARTARWLARQLELSAPEHRVRIQLELAISQMAAGQEDGAIETLSKAFDAHPADPHVRTLLEQRLRAAGRLAELADVLLRAAEATRDAADKAALAREATRLFHVTGQRPEGLVEAAELARSLEPEDTELCRMLADGLRALGRHDEARQVLLHLLALLGRRRTPERAAVHVQLAEVCRAEGDLESSCAQLELALKMHAHDVGIMLSLAERAREAGDLPRRERALHALRLVAKRGPIQLDDGRELGFSEVLLELSDVASERGDEEQASTLRESALGALKLGDQECERIKASARTRGQHELLERLLRLELRDAASNVERAACLGALAELLARRPDSREAVFELRLEAVEHDAGDPRLHEAALEAAPDANAMARYRVLLERLRERLRRPTDAYARCEVCLRLGGLLLATKELDEALACYLEAQATGVRQGDVWRAQLRVAEARGDQREQARILSLLDGLGCAEIEAENRVDVLYTLAEIRLGADTTRDEGIARMREAMAEAHRPMRALTIVLRALEAHPRDEELFVLLRELAAKSSDTELDQLAELCVTHSQGAALSALLDGVELANDQARAMLLVRRAQLLMTEDPASPQAGELLREASTLRPEDLELEAKLLAYYRSSSQADLALAHLVARFEEARARGDAERVVRYALELDGCADANRDVDVLALLRDALSVAPTQPGLRRALLARLPESSHGHERARMLEDDLEHGAVDDAARVALEASRLYASANDAEGARRVLTLGRKRAPAHAELLRALVEATRTLDDPKALAELLEQSSRLEGVPSRRAASLNEAARLLRTRLGDPERALKLLEEAVWCTPEDVKLRRELAEELLGAGRRGDAIDHLEALLARTEGPERLELLLMRGRALVVEQEIATALEAFEEAFTLAPDAAADDLIQVLEHMRSIESESSNQAARAATVRLATVLDARGDALRAAVLLEDLVTQHDDEDALDKLASIYRRFGWVDELARVLMIRMRLATGEGLGRIAHELAGLAASVTEPAHVRDALEQAHAANPDSKDLEDALMEALAAMADRHAMARVLLARAERTDDLEQRATALAQAAEHLLAVGALGEATRALTGICAAFPGDADRALSLADTLIMHMHFQEARALLEGVLARQAEGPSVARSRLLIKLADTALALRDGEAALAHLQAAREADKSNRQILAKLAVLAEDLGAWDVAEKALTALLLLKGADVMPRAEALLRRARVAAQHDDPQRALLWARKALEANPSSEAAAALVRMYAGERA